MIKRIDIISDPNCPFCAIGFLELQKAIQSKNISPKINWHPYLINPHLNDNGLDLRENLKGKYAFKDDQIEANFQNIAAKGQALGFKFNYPQGKMVYPSLRAHEFVRMARDEQKTAIYLSLMEAFFTNSQNINDIDVLLSIAKIHGLDLDKTKDDLISQKHSEEIKAEILYWQNQGIQGVPSFIFEEKYFVSGAIGISGFENIIEQVQDQI